MSNGTALQIVANISMVLNVFQALTIAFLIMVLWATRQSWLNGGE